MRAFVYGHTRVPRSTFDIYRAPYTGLATFSGEVERIDIEAASGGRYVDRLERSYLKARGHRHGAKGRTLRDHRGA